MRRMSALVLLLFIGIGVTQCHTGKKVDQDRLSASGTSGTAESGLQEGAAAGQGVRNGEEEKRPKILFDETEHDFGKVEAGDEVEHAFSFRNDGDVPLVIRKVRTSCGCTAGVLSSEEIPPGATGVIKATFRSKGFMGPVEKSLSVESNDPKERFVRLSLRAEVVSEVTVEPQYLNWGAIGPETSPGTFKLRIRLRKGAGIQIQEVRAESESVILKKNEEDEEGAVYTVSLSKNLPKGRLVGRISVRTDSEKMPEVQVPFHAIVEGDVKVSPSLLSFAPVRPGKPVSRFLTLEKRGGGDLSVKKIKATTEAIHAELGEEKKNSRVRIKVTFDPETRTEGHIVERITIFLENEEEEIIEVPVYGRIQKEEKGDRS